MRYINLTSGDIKFTNFPENQLLTTVSVKLLVRQPPGQPDLFLRPCGMRTFATDAARNVARLSEMPLSEGADSRGHKKPWA